MANTYADTIDDHTMIDLFSTHGTYNRPTSQWEWNGYCLRNYGMDGGVFIYGPDGMRVTTRDAYEALCQI